MNTFNLAPVGFLLFISIQLVKSPFKGDNGGLIREFPLVSGWDCNGDLVGSAQFACQQNLCEK